VEANETQFKDPHIENLYKWLRDRHRPDKCERKPMETFVYWSSYHRLRIFGKNVFRCLENSDYGTHYQYLVPIDERPAVLKKIHDDPFSGHRGVDKNFEKLKLRFYWPNYRKDTANYILGCEICASIKAPKAYTRQPIVPIKAYKLFELITWDILGPLQVPDNFLVSWDVLVVGYCATLDIGRCLSCRGGSNVTPHSPRSPPRHI
ncbi:Retrovirus-related Pol poly from transposon, partial [Brachionus plicatilis]